MEQSVRLGSQQAGSLFEPVVTDIISHADHQFVRRIESVGGDIDHDVFPHRELGPLTPIASSHYGTVAGAFLDPACYDPETMVMCFEPGVRYEFHRGRRVVSIDVCFECTMLRAGIADDTGQPQGGLICFAPGYRRLLSVTKAVLPDDPGIQSILAR